MDGTHAELIAVPETNVYPIPDSLSFEEAAAFPLVFETAWRMLVTKAAPPAGRMGLDLGDRRRRRHGGARDRQALGARAVVTSSSDDKLTQAVELGADATVNHATPTSLRASRS